MMVLLVQCNAERRYHEIVTTTYLLLIVLYFNVKSFDVIVIVDDRLFDVCCFASSFVVVGAINQLQ